ncbi:hypothetical protein RD1_A0019 (plasmid) [Roseobacter denitrificans OCh 114]|uniref:Uncharacterized protein n=1 Tax=Roseobacter denitrificans (strain ATCC 33942 / OCh 114) TaxID=375451 RepID=Q07GS6_ROSDO|nr:hypothetical protein RD1_A0019 [Roseobacter denitrificans OCh 114]
MDWLYAAWVVDNQWQPFPMADFRCARSFSAEFAVDAPDANID